MNKELEMRARELLATVSDPDQVNMMPAVRRLVVNGLTSIIDGIAALSQQQRSAYEKDSKAHLAEALTNIIASTPMDDKLFHDAATALSQQPSAVVGRDSVGTDAAVWGLISAAVECGAVPDEDDNGIWWTLNLPAFYKLEAKIHAAKSPQQVAGVPDMSRVVRNLRSRADSGHDAHGHGWCDGVRFAANKIEVALAATPKPEVGT
ncbi:MAG: hypothetical protein ACOH2T_19030 [Pseudomonas sp.]